MNGFSARSDVGDVIYGYHRHTLEIVCDLTSRVVAHLDVDLMPFCEGKASLDRLYVAPGYRQRGLASYLLEWAEREYAGNRLILFPSSEYTDDGDMSQAELYEMYRRRGYQPEGDDILDNWYKDVPASIDH